jgi:hypothetical protein
MVTFPPETETFSIASEYVLNLADPSMSSFALGETVPIPTSCDEVVVITVPLVPTTKVEVVTIPDLIFDPELSKR